MKEPHPPLSFVLPLTSTESEKINYWSVTETGTWSADNALGRAAADEYVTYLRGGGAVVTLSFITKAMREQPRCAGIEVGFWTRVAEHLSQPA